MTPRALTTLAVAAIVTITTTAPAGAGLVTARLDGISPSLPIRVHHSSLGGSRQVRAGVNQWTFLDGRIDGLGQSFDAFCIELGQNVQPVQQFEVTQVSEAPAPHVAPIGPMGEADATLLARLWVGYFDQIVNPKTAVAFQLAAWEIVHETSGVLDVDGGDFYASTHGGARKLSNAWLATVGGPAPIDISHYEFYGLSSVDGQDMFAAAASHAPLPHSLGAGLLMLVIAGREWQRRRRLAQLD